MFLRDKCINFKTYFPNKSKVKVSFHRSVYRPVKKQGPNLVETRPKLDLNQTPTKTKSAKLGNWDKIWTKPGQCMDKSRFQLMLKCPYVKVPQI